LGLKVLQEEWLFFTTKEHLMKDSIKDKVEGTTHELKGAGKERLGHLTNDPNLEGKGKAENVAGKIQKKVGDVEEVLEK
jgi:uncharacterized protein YjbJ (UPF0337 family)